MVISGAALLDLFVAGVQPAVADRAKALEPTSSRTSPKKEGVKAKTVFNKKQQQQESSTTPPAVEEMSNESTNQADADQKQPHVFWVDISKKLGATPLLLDRKLSSGTPTQKTPRSPKIVPTPVLAQLVPNFLPDGFQKFLQQNLQLIAEVETAKMSRSLNRQISRPREDNDNWTSNAPRPSAGPERPAKSSKRNKRKEAAAKRAAAETLLPCLEGVHLEETRMVQKTKGKLKSTRKKNKNQQHQVVILWPDDDTQKTVTFLLPNKSSGKKIKV